MRAVERETVLPLRLRRHVVRDDERMRGIRGVDDARVVSVGRIVGFHVRGVDVGSIGPTRIDLDVVGSARRYLAPEDWIEWIRDVIEAYARERAETKTLLEDLKVNQPALGYSHPDWLCERWQKRWGTEKLRQLLEWNNTPPKTYARVNGLKTGAGNLLEQ